MGPFRPPADICACLESLKKIIYNILFYKKNAILSPSERLYWIWRERHQSSSQGEKFLVRDKLQRAPKGAGEDLRMLQESCY